MARSVDNIKQEGKQIVQKIHEELKTIRTGRANPSLVESIIIETYGGQAKLRLLELASILTEGPSALSIVPFDPATLSDIEKGILKSPLGLTPAVQGNRIIVKLPALSEEQREKMIRLGHQIIEEKRNLLRIRRDDARKQIKKMFEVKEITEDDKYRQEKEIDAIVQNFMKEIDTIREKKDAEIMEV
jgi:ribosome recycling factor